MSLAGESYASLRSTLSSIVQLHTRFVDRSGSPLGCESDTTACGHGVAGRPRSSSTRMSRKEREGRRLRQEQPPPKPERVRPTGPPALPPPPLNLNAADVKASSTGPGSSSCPAAAGDAQICNKGVVLSRPTATRSGARASTCQICLGEYVLIRNKTNKWL